MAFEEAAGEPGPCFTPSVPTRFPGGNPLLQDSSVCFLPSQIFSGLTLETLKQLRINNSRPGSIFSTSFSSRKALIKLTVHVIIESTLESRKYGRYSKHEAGKETLDY